MDAQSAIISSRLSHVREMRDEISHLRDENARLRAEADALAAHFAFALLAAQDLASLKPGACYWLVDGWNAILGAKPAHAPTGPFGRPASPEDLLANARAHLAEHPDDFVWVVFDGAREDTRVDGRLRVSYTGGTGPQRADRFILDFLRMACWRFATPPIEVVTDDKRLRREVARLTGAARQGRGVT